MELVLVKKTAPQNQLRVTRYFRESVTGKYIADVCMG